MPAPVPPLLQTGIGIVAPYDFALDRELWRWVPDDVTLQSTIRPGVSGSAIHGAFYDVIAARGLVKDSRIGYSIGIRIRSTGASARSACERARRLCWRPGWHSM